MFAAASMAGVLPVIAREFTQRTGVPVRFSFAASSLLARQIEAGARADVFVSADDAWMAYLASRLPLRARQTLALNRLVLVVPKESTARLTLGPGLDLSPILGPRGRLAIADPQAVPAGRYAAAALRKYGAWDGLKSRLAPAQNVRDALLYVARGDAPIGVVYATDARADPRVRVLALFPADSHPPIRYPAAVVTGRPEAAALLVFATGPIGRAAFARAGFGLP